MVADYEPQDQQRCIRCLKNDIIFVQKPFLFHFMVSCINFIEQAYFLQRQLWINVVKVIVVSVIKDYIASWHICIIRQHFYFLSFLRKIFDKLVPKS